MKILLIRNDNIGDLICTTPAIEALRDRYKDAQIDIVVNSYNYIAIKNNPFINRIYCYTKPKHLTNPISKLKALIQKGLLLYEISKAKYDVAVIFRASYSDSAALFAKASKSKIIIGVKKDGAKSIITHEVIPKDTMHEVELCFEHLKHLNINYSGQKVQMYPDSYLKELFLWAKDGIVLHISSRKETNRLSNTQWIALIKELKRFGELFINFVKQDEKLAKEIAQKSDTKLVPTKNIEELIGLFLQAKLIVTLDGGALHIAPALGIKTIGILGSTKLERWYPWGYKELTIKSPTNNAKDIDIKEIVKKVEIALAK